MRVNFSQDLNRTCNDYAKAVHPSGWKWESSLMRVKI
nr:MAG TPA: hypothetical protein [Caudoviricetes sp.]